MKRFLGLAGALAAALVMLLGVGTSAANPYDPYYGATYAKVMERTSNTAVIASRVGSYLPTDECIVTGTRKTVFNGSTKLLVDLNCNDPKSAGGDGNDHPGNSVASPAGAKMAVQKDRAARFSKNYAASIEASKPPFCENEFNYCKQICQQSGACSAELNEYLGL